MSYVSCKCFDVKDGEYYMLNLLIFTNYISLGLQEHLTIVIVMIIFWFSVIMFFFQFQLIQLDVSENRLETLPESIGNCKSLEELIANGSFTTSSKHFIMLSLL